MDKIIVKKPAVRVKVLDPQNNINKKKVKLTTDVKEIVIEIIDGGNF